MGATIPFHDLSLRFSPGGLAWPEVTSVLRRWGNVHELSLMGGLRSIGTGKDSVRKVAGMFLEVGGRDAVCFGFRWEPGVLVYRPQIGVIRLLIVARVIGVFSLSFRIANVY